MEFKDLELVKEIVAAITSKLEKPWGYSELRNGNYFIEMPPDVARSCIYKHIIDKD